MESGKNLFRPKKEITQHFAKPKSNNYGKQIKAQENK
jgi:hypothetical protein